jgi:glutathione S-transferase
MLRILGKAASINVRKVLWTCDELGLPFAREDWGAGLQSTQQPSFLALNPNALVPVLVDGDFVLWESHAICRYLAHRNDGAALLPADARQRARVDQWMDWQATELNNAWRYAFMALVRRSPQHRDSAQIAASVASWNRHVGILDDHLARVRSSRWPTSSSPCRWAAGAWRRSPGPTSLPWMRTARGWHNVPASSSTPEAATLRTYLSR